jgi:hypothetical protein
MALLDLIRSELARRRSGNDPLIITIKGGLSDMEPTEAKFGETVLLRQPAEPVPAFEARAHAAAKQAGADAVLIGGLPD